MARRYAFFATPAVANGAQSGPQNVTTFDDFQTRTLKQIRIVVPTAGLRYQLLVAGRVFLDLDSSTYTAAGPPPDLDQPYGPGILIQVNVINNSGAGIPANAGLQIIYEAASFATSGAP